MRGDDSFDDSDSNEEDYENPIRQPPIVVDKISMKFVSPHRDSPTIAPPIPKRNPIVRPSAVFKRPVATTSAAELEYHGKSHDNHLSSAEYLFEDSSINTDAKPFPAPERPSKVSQDHTRKPPPLPLKPLKPQSPSHYLSMTGPSYNIGRPPNSPSQQHSPVPKDLRSPRHKFSPNPTSPHLVVPRSAAPSNLKHQFSDDTVHSTSASEEGTSNYSIS